MGNSHCSTLQVLAQGSLKYSFDLFLIVFALFACKMFYLCFLTYLNSLILFLILSIAFFIEKCLCVLFSLTCVSVVTK